MAEFPFTTSGGPDAVRLFGEIGRAAEAAQAKVDRANRRAEIGLRAVNATMKDAKGIAQSYVSSLGPVGSGLSALSSGGVAGAAVVGILGVTGALIAGTKAAIDYGSTLKDSADKVGLNTETLQAYSFAAGQAGVSAQTFQTAVQTLVLQLGQAQVGQGKLAKALKDTDPAFLAQLKHIGDTGQQFEFYIKHVAEAGSVQEKARLLAAAFGRTLATELIPFVNQGAEGIENLTRRAKELGVIVPEEAVEGLESAGDKVEELSAVIKGNLTTALAGLAPVLGGVSTLMSEFVGALGQAITQTVGLTTSGRLAQLKQDLAGLRDVPTEGFGALSPAAADKRQLENELRDLRAQQRDRQATAAADRTAQAQVTRTLGAREAFEQAQEGRAKKTDDPKEKIEQLKQDKKRELEVVLTALREHAISVEEFKKEEQRIDKFYADQRNQILDKAGKEDDARQKRENETLKGLRDEGRRAQQTSALSGLGDAEARWLKAQQAIDDYARKVKENVKDEKEAARLIGDFRTSTEQEASNDIAEIRAKGEKKAADAVKSAAQDLRHAQQEAAIAGADDASKVWLEAQQSIDDYTEKTLEAVPDIQEAWRLIGEFRVATEEDASKKIGEIHEKEAEKTAKENEKAAKEAQKQAEESAKPFLDAIEGIGASLTDALVDGFLSGEKQAKKSSDVIKDMFIDVGKEILRSLIQKSFVEPLQQQVLGFLGQAQAVKPGAGGATTPAMPIPAGGSGSGFLGWLGNLFGGGGAPAKAAATTQPLVGPLPEGVAESSRPLVEATGGLTASTEGLAESTSSLSSTVTGLAAVVVALAGAGQSIAEGRESFDKATLGASGSQAAKNALTTVRATLVAVFTAAGAAAGAAAFGVGALPGAAIGAAVGNEIGKAIEKAVVGGIKSGVNEGLNQAQLEKKVTKSLSDDLLLTIVFGGTNKTAIGGFFGKLFAPDIENIFAKIFRQVLGGTGGFSTEGIAVKQRGFAGFNVPGGGGTGLITEAQSLTRLIAESFGAGGEAFGDLRSGYLTAILLGAVRKEVQRSIRRGTPSPADLELARAFATAFQGNFYDALAIALKQGGEAPGLVSRTFAKAQGLQPGTFERLRSIVQEQGRVPLGQARKASREAFGDAIQASFKDAADSSAFRHSLEDSVQNAFAKKAVTALDKGFGQLFAPFFALGKEERREFQRAKRRGQFVGEGGALDILTTNFVEGAQDFAKVVADPAFLKAMADLQDSFLNLQVAMSLASGDIEGAASAIEERLAPAIKLVKDVAEFQLATRARIDVALAGPSSFAQGQANLRGLTARREQAERDFSAQMGGATLGDFGRLLRGEVDTSWVAALDKGLVAADQALTQQDPQKLLQGVQAFADARLSELEAELDLARQQAEFFKQTQRAFKDLADQAEAAEGKGHGAARFQTTIDDALKATYIAAAKGLEDPETIADLQEKLQAAISEAAERVQVFKAFEKTFRDMRLGIDRTLGRADDRGRINELLAAANVADPTDPLQMADAAEALGEAVQLATARFEAFTAAVKVFKQVVESIDVALGRLDQRDLFAKRQAEIQELLPKALTGDLTATQDIQAPLQQAVQLATARREQFKAAAEEFKDLGEQAGIVRRGSRAQRAALARRREEVTRLLAVARAGGPGADDAITSLRKLLPETLALGQQILGRNRLRGLAGETEAAAGELERLSQDQVDIAEKQLKALELIAASLTVSSEREAAGARAVLEDIFRKAGILGLVATDQKNIALGQLVALGQIATAVAGSAGTSAADAQADAESVQGQIKQFRDDIEPVLTYLGGKATTTLYDQFEAVKKLLGAGPDGQIVAALVRVENRLPQADTGGKKPGKAEGGPVIGGQAYWVGERGPETFVPKTTGTIVPAGASSSQSVTINAPLTLHLAVPERMTRAEADDLARTLQAPMERHMQRAAARVVSQLRKVS